MTEEQYLASLAEAPPLPSCEFCGDTDGLVNDPTPHVPTLCLLCACQAQAEVYPEVVANVGAVVARAARPLVVPLDEACRLSTLFSGWPGCRCAACRVRPAVRILARAAGRAVA